MRRARSFLLLPFLCAPLFAACGGGDGTTPTPDGGGDGGTLPPMDAGGADAKTDATSDAGVDAAKPHQIQTVFMILMENHSWSTISASKSAAYINGTLVPMGAHAEQYFTPPKLHPSEPNYIWLEAGDNLGITNDNPPADNHRNTTDHFTTQLEKAGVSWKAYSEDVSGTGCPLTKSGLYDPKHTPQLFFDDVTNTNDANSKNCEAHVRPYTELATDLTNGTVARYNFITPNLCNDMHGQAIGLSCQIGIADMIKKGDTWLAAELPKIFASNAYKNGGVVFLLWDEGDENLINGASDGPIPLLVLSPLAKKGYLNGTHYTHSDMLHTLETIFEVPYLRDAKNGKDLSDFFTAFP